ncbi:alpha/beta hydrolase family protein [Solimicrobium silvestre]|uniref:Prolyl oligopeptidase family n=1 Tax=Solimicrobium silvestre TaxID=2099400 RepID=A0A2S9GYW5_9BURK|nr:S9 family peptidase [Solimicrobium silvestre]PRC92919.1 Prolyl oligopeptidase family [Solimicrobium silvestre]
MAFLPLLKKFVHFIILFSLACAPVCVAALTFDDALSPAGIQAATLSPDGKHIAAIAFTGMNHGIILIDVDTNKAKLINSGKWTTRGNIRYSKEARKVFWIGNDLLAVDFGAYSETITLEGKSVTDIGDIVIGKLNTGQPDSPMLLVHDDFRDDDISIVNAKTGKMTGFSLPGFGTPDHWTFDKHGQLRAITMFNSAFWKDVTTVTNWYRPDTTKPWVKLDEFKVTDNYWFPVAVSDKENTLIISSNMGRDTRAIFSYDTVKHEIGEMMAGHPTQDILDVEGINLDSFTSVLTNGMMPQRFWFDPDWDQIQKTVDAALPKRINIISGDTANRILVFSYSDIDPGRWFILDIPTMKMHLVAEAKPKIDPDKMLPMEIISYPSKDGFVIPAYLTRPANAKGMQPTIVLIHGGPWVRDTWDWNMEVQLLADRGYAIFQPQFRGSYGFGLKFQEAGYQQWGKSMQDDITAGVDYLIKEGIADPKRICIYGASYGGYAALWGLVKTPDLYQCGISFAGVSDIGDMLEDSSDRNHNKITREVQRSRIGDIAMSKEQFAQVSPLKHADQIKAPLLLLHGEDDRRVPISHSKNMMQALDANHKVYEWVEFADEGHGLTYVKDSYRFYEALFKFLDKYNPPDPKPIIEHASEVKSPQPETDESSKPTP